MPRKPAAGPAPLPTVLADLSLPHRLPVVQGDRLVLPEGEPVPLDTPDWDAWLAGHLVFQVAHPAGTYTVARERRQRGGHYWVARAYDQGRRASFYIGTRVAAADLDQAGAELAARIAEQQPVQPRPRPRRRVLSEYQLEQIVGDSDPQTMRMLAADLVGDAGDPERRAAAAAILRLIDVIWPDVSPR